MIKYIILPENGTVAFYLAAEEFAARYFDFDCFFMWQVEPSVIFGRNQLIENEVNVDYCREHGIKIYRRKSGGGCVYADKGNIMFSYINSGNGVQFTFNKYINMVAHLLNKLGVDAKASSRNDITIDGKKVSGNAFYHVPRRNIVHGTMLYDTNMDNMVGSITPSNDKLVSKGVESVRQRVTLLKNHVDMDLASFKDYIRQNLCDATVTLTPENMENIRSIEKEYLTEDFIFGNNPRYTLTRKKRIEGVGDFDVRIELKNGIIKNIDILGDYFPCGDVSDGLLSKLHNVNYTRKDISNALGLTDIRNYILELDKKNLLDLIIDN